MTKQFALLRLSWALSRPRLALLAVVLLGLLLRIAYAAAIYEPSLLAYGLDDYILYRVGAELIAQGDLSFSHDLFLLRPPLFPLLVAALQLNDFAVIAANILFGTSVIPLTYMLARMLRLSPQRSLLPAFLVALDLTSIKHAGVLLAEPLANVLLACAFVCVLATRDSQQGKTAILWGWLTGGCIILSAFARPAAYMLWLPMALWLLANIRSRGGGGFCRCSPWSRCRCWALGFGYIMDWQHLDTTLFPRLATGICFMCGQHRSGIKPRSKISTRSMQNWRGG